MKVNELIEDTVKSTLLEFSIIKPVSDDSDAISFSPELNVPTTCVRTSCVPDVKEPKTKPVAPDVLPFICTPPLVLFAINVGLGVSFNVRFV